MENQWTSRVNGQTYGMERILSLNKRLSVNLPNDLNRLEKHRVKGYTVVRKEGSKDEQNRLWV